MPAIIVDGAAVEIFPGIPFVDASGIQRPANWLDLSTPEDRAEAQVLAIVEPPAPGEGMVIVITGLSVVDGKPTRTFEEQAAPTPPAPVAPDNPTLGDWRVGLTLWTRQDENGATISRLTDVTNAVAEMMGSTNAGAMVMGQIAHQRLEYSNNVLKAEVTQLAPAFKFTADEVEESFWRALRASLGDLSGAWPLPSGQDPFAPPARSAA